jgi:hypothetical protein
LLYLVSRGRTAIPITRLSTWWQQLCDQAALTRVQADYCGKRTITPRTIAVADVQWATAFVLMRLSFAEPKSTRLLQVT